MFNLSRWSSNAFRFLVTIVVLVALAAGCSQPAATPVPTQAPKVAPAKEAKPETKEAKPDAKEAKPVAKEAPPKSDAAKPEAKKEQRLTKIVLPYAGVTGAQLPLWVAQEKGIFEKYGLDVEAPLIGQSTLLTQAMIAGETNAGVMGGGAMAMANLSGAEIVAVAGWTNILVFSLYSVPSLTRVEDLKGKSLGAGRFSSVTDFAARYALKRVGIDPDKDVALVETGLSPETLAALQTGGIQAAVFGPPTNLRAKQMGMRELISITDMAVPYFQNGLVVTKKYLASNEEVVRNLVKALTEGIAIMKKDKDFTIKMLTKYTNTNDAMVLEETHDIFVSKVIPRVPYVPVEAMQTILDEVAPQNPKAKQTKPESLMDNRLVKELDDAGFIKKLYGE